MDDVASTKAIVAGVTPSIVSPLIAVVVEFAPIDVDPRMIGKELDPPETVHQPGAAPADPVPVMHRNFWTVVVFGASSTVVSGAD
jgi:hypothetical protein